MTELLYYIDAYISEFDARVLGVSESGDRYICTLDKTAFFPEEGGQYSDTGYIGDARVLDVKIKDGVVYHTVDKALSVGADVHCTIDFAERYEKMQCHSAEHLLCGLIHKHYGYDNVGFHLGRDYVTFDISAPLSREQLDLIEEEANRAIYENREIFAEFPEPDELSSMEYRAKLEMTENVRIVTIDGYDACACCAPHVRRTGEIGVIKLLEVVSHRGGVRIFLTAGYRAFLDYRARYVEVQKISAMLSEPKATVADAVARQSATLADTELRLSEARRDIARLYAERLSPDADYSVMVLDGFSPNELREYANIAKERFFGYIVALSGEDGAYKYVITKRGADLSLEIKKINAALGGVGGGRGEMVQGSFSATLSDIENYFKTLPKN